MLSDLGKTQGVFTKFASVQIPKNSEKSWEWQNLQKSRKIAMTVKKYKNREQFQISWKLQTIGKILKVEKVVENCNFPRKILKIAKIVKSLSNFPLFWKCDFFEKSFKKCKYNEISKIELFLR